MFNLISWILFFPLKLIGKLFSGLFGWLGCFLFFGDMNGWK